MSTTDLQQRIAVARDYDMLTGLMPACTGIGLVGAAIVDGAWPLWAASIAGGIASGWYRRRHGTHRTGPRRSAAAAAIALVWGGSLLAAMSHDQHTTGPVLLTPLVAAAGLGVGEWLGLRHVGLTTWHWATVILLGLCCLAPVLGWERNGVLSSVVFLGPALVVVGLVDHHRLTTALGKVRA